MNFLYENNLPKDLKSKRSVATWQPSHDSPFSYFKLNWSMRGCFTRSKRSHLVHFTQNSSNKQTQSTHRKARLEPAIRDAQKLGQNIFTPWNSLLGYGFEPRLNSLAHVTAGSVMITGLSIKEMPALGKEVCKYKTRWTWRLKFGVGKPQRLDVIQTKLPFLLPTQEDKGRLGSQQKIK